MKKMLLKFAAVWLIPVGSLVSCGEKETQASCECECEEKETPASCEEKETPVEIPFKEYSLSETFCYWTYYGDSVFIVNSIEELEKYIVCTNGDHYPEIDFSGNTLLLVTGPLPQSPYSVKTEAYTSVGNKYELKGEVRMGSATKPTRWFLSILVPKLTADAIIKTNINIIGPP
jgi:hypothetical protein